MVKAVIFDLDNTLYDYDAINDQAIEYTGKWLCFEAGITYEKFQNAFDTGRAVTKKSMGDCASQHNRIIYFQKASEYLGLNPIKYSLELYDKYWGYILDNMQLVRGIDKLLKRLKESGINVAICTDLTTHIQHRKLRKLGIADYIDVFVSSEEANAEKPDIKIFNMTILKLGVSASKSLYVGDSYEKDVIGAAKAGMYPIWFNPYHKCRKGEEIKDMLEIADMKQLEEYIYQMHVD